MKTFNYENDSPIMEFEISGKKGSKELKGYLDTGAADVVVPEKVREEVGLTWLGNTSILTVGGIVPEDVYLGEIEFLGKSFEVTIISRDLPEMESLIGREILDRFKICFNGPEKQIEVYK